VLNFLRCHTDKNSVFNKRLISKGLYIVTRVISLECRARMKDRELIERMEALDELIGWLEDKDDADMLTAAEQTEVEEAEVEAWLKNPKLKKVREWLEHK